jgi:hypothetical protein
VVITKLVNGGMVSHDYLEVESFFQACMGFFMTLKKKPWELYDKETFGKSLQAKCFFTSLFPNVGTLKFLTSSL